VWKKERRMEEKGKIMEEKGKDGGNETGGKG